MNSETDWFIWPAVWLIAACGFLSFFSWLGPTIVEKNNNSNEQKEKKLAEEQTIVENNKKTAIVKMVKSEIIDGNTIYYIVAEDKNNSLENDTIQIKSGYGAIWVEENSIITYSYSPTEGFCSLSVIGKEE